MKNYVLALLLVSFTTLSLAQDVKYGVRGALNVSNLDFEPDAGFDNQHRNGFAFGGFADIGLSESLYLLTELQWSAEGGRDESIRADYIKLPILLRYALSENFTFGLGPQAALKTWGHNDGFATFAFAGVAGLEYMITDDLFFDIRYTYGLSDILDDQAGDLEAKNHVMQFGFGIKI
ncbi:outer membrane protein with beta-barrel domain [Winogradskyella epiphytica]|uniref:Outer membrane protein with beta-barrel domain n=1 Tax=Winogradskyella epiphytica TaxID=262005 RepID=A0A2V4XU19_9FLAO|nr:porin family protein [Winogradskyella epiphytica]PYE81861.1 outer membrane protein with beta-barrel domain [Winogradskyella epiphytica]GGW62132.1 hypothetical protein GCM10008085_12320 [Winogradskyella epiphytica]